MTVVEYINASFNSFFISVNEIGTPLNVVCVPLHPTHRSFNTGCSNATPVRLSTSDQRPPQRFPSDERFRPIDWIKHPHVLVPVLGPAFLDPYLDPVFSLTRDGYRLLTNARIRSRVLIRHRDGTLVRLRFDRERCRSTPVFHRLRSPLRVLSRTRRTLPSSSSMPMMMMTMMMMMMSLHKKWNVVLSSSSESQRRPPSSFFSEYWTRRRALLPVVPAVAVLMVTKENQKSSLSLSLSCFLCVFSPSFFFVVVVVSPFEYMQKEESLARPHTNEDQVRTTGVLCCALGGVLKYVCGHTKKGKWWYIK